MNKVFESVKGAASGWLLARPSSRSVNQASLRVALVICTLIAIVAITFSLAQWYASDRLYRLQSQHQSDLEASLGLANDLAVRQVNSHRMTLNAMLARDQAERDEAISSRASNLSEYSRLLDTPAAKAPKLRATREAMIAAMADYRSTAEQLTDLIAADKMDEALAFRVATVRPAFDNWQSAQLRFALDAAALGKEQAAESAEEMARMREVVATLVLVPAALVLLGVAALIAMLGIERLGAKAGAKDAWSR